jgi:hypothetical protein
MGRRRKRPPTAWEVGLLDRRLTDRGTRNLIRDLAELLGTRSLDRRFAVLERVARRVYW